VKCEESDDDRELRIWVMERKSRPKERNPVGGEDTLPRKESILVEMVLPKVVVRVVVDSSEVVSAMMASRYNTMFTIGCVAKLQR
jgi:hypothetical protein